MKHKTFNFFKKTIISIIENDFSGMAAEMSYMLVIGIFPFLLFLMSLFNLIGKNYYMNPLFIFLEKVMPADTLRMIYSVLNQVLGFASGRTVAVFGLLVTLFMSMNALSVVIKGLNRAYKVEETRAFVYTRFLSLIMVVVNTLVLFLSINLIIFGRVIIRFLIASTAITADTGTLFLAIRWPIAFLALFVMAFLHYYIFPDVSWSEELKCKSALPGTMFFCVIWLIASGGFSIYVNKLHTYNFVYGSIAAFAMLMIWFYFTSMLVLIGGEINSQVHDKLEQDKILAVLEQQEEMAKKHGFYEEYIDDNKDNL
ncbi:MAG: YihY/virulence factor BrkB family protein [Candidatus Gastranaerophilales bacterium]|nr:YihY/virulence factor BrkB family protein [Candidatus Gastranaerophilales bacterium]